MPSLHNAYVQRSYRPVLWVFSAFVVILMGVALTAGAASATITITPKIIPVDATLSQLIGPKAAAPTGLAGKVMISTVAASATALPSSQGTSVPAHAHGSVVIHNDSGAGQALVAGTRLESTAEVIVRTASRVDVPAHSTVTVNVTADPEGESGNLAAGRLTIVALRAANQALIYGQVVTPLTGGTTTQKGTLGIDALTAASDQAKDKIRQQVGNDSPGHLRLLIPAAVSTQPEASTPSTSYTVTVSMKLLDVTYAASDMDQRIRQELTDQVAADQHLTSVAQPTISAGDQPSSDSLTLNIKAQGEASLSSTSAVLDSSKYTGLSEQQIMTKLLGNASVKAVTVQFSPWWRKNAPDQTSRIHVQLLGQAGS